MTKKVIGIGLVCLLTAYNFGEANIVQFGPRFSMANLTLKVKAQGYANRKLQPASGWQAGVFTRLSVPIIAIQPELLFSNSSIRHDSQEGNIKVTYANLELPVMLSISILGIVRIQIGPNFTCLLRAQESNQQASTIKDIKLDYKILQIGYQVGLGIDIGRWIVDLKYADGLNQLTHNIFNIADTTEQNLWLLSLGFNML